MGIKSELMTTTSSKQTLAVLFGGKSQEHEISLISAKGILAHLDRNLYEIMPIWIDQTGQWWWQSDLNCLAQINEPKAIDLSQTAKQVAVIPGNQGELCILDTNEIVQIDVAFPIVHGINGEDGLLQGLLETCGIAYVGANVLSSAICMDKYMLKCLLRDANLPTPDFKLLTAQYDDTTLDDIINTLGLPCFVKPVDQGSSIGIHKATSFETLKTGVIDAFRYSNHVILEAFVDGREFECAVLGNETPQATKLAELICEDEFYSYEAKYLTQTTHFELPAKLNSTQQAAAQALAIKAYQIARCTGLARVDFFLNKQGTWLINEINTLPGFTPISLYPSMWEAEGLGFSDLLNTLIQLGISKKTASLI